MNQQHDSRLADKFVVRMPDGMRSMVEARAGVEDRSMNSLVVQALRQYLDNQQRQELLLNALAAAAVKKVEQP
ncbi:Arc family DNA-binding protein [Pseudomonas sp. NFACC05-1]|uniref:Arc family DNA-binding protein n=1 Tax=Pseudomonas sp. NFACC05-1 TaxID=1566241 RepID=UPI0008717B00|nr:Arc family DNA-binding protein [Pseudomonas sp. NFACC05-1]SCW91953.1 Arc-like DNA binding domain-containing protein [Pseudomonas sp. NFACC05-1]